jgi:hypothetical protein
VCRLCDAKPSVNYAFMFSVDNEQNEQCIPCIRFTSNKLDPQAIEVDTFVCPSCEPYSASLTLVNNDRPEDDEYFRPFSGVTRFGNNILVSGGVDLTDGISSNECAVVKFKQDGRNFYFVRNTYTSELSKSRHAHGTFYFEKEKTLYVFGGAQKIKESELAYLDSIECFSVLDSSVNFNGEGEWQSCAFKLKKPRCSFAQVRVGNKLVLFGGFSGINKVENSLEVIDFDTKTVTSVALASGFSAPIYPIIFESGKNQITVLGGFASEMAKNNDIFVVDYQTGSVQPQPPKGLPVSNRLHSLSAFGSTFVFGGNCFDRQNTSQSGKFKSLRDGVEGVIIGGYKGLKKESIESIKSLMDCFGSEAIEFNLVV